MIQLLVGKLIGKALINKVFDAIEKADDKRIASNHEKRIKKLEKEKKNGKNCKCNCN
tara:strand:- start:800 stop:970 length:171 start_codon:yes stop_codon:yes gene_type:complete